MHIAAPCAVARFRLNRTGTKAPVTGDRHSFTNFCFSFAGGHVTVLGARPHHIAFLYAKSNTNMNKMIFKKYVKVCRMMDHGSNCQYLCSLLEP